MGVVTILPGACEYLFIFARRAGAERERAREQEQAHSRGDDATPGAGERDLREGGHGVCAGELQLQEEVVRGEDEAVHQCDRGLCGSPRKVESAFQLHLR